MMRVTTGGGHVRAQRELRTNATAVTKESAAASQIMTKSLWNSFVRKKSRSDMKCREAPRMRA